MNPKIIGGAIVVGFLMLAISYAFMNRFQVVHRVDQGVWIEKNLLTNEYYTVGDKSLVNEVGKIYMNTIVKVKSKTEIHTWKSN